MSQFPVSTTKDLLDEAVRRTRATPPPASALNKRAVPRMSIDEINATDYDTLREKYLNTRRDDRGPVESFLDLLDAPRNTIFHILAPSLEKRSREAGNVGSFGQGRVSFSDVLGETGIKPGLARGILGFVGDVAFDPLTYIGPAGWGAKVGTASGKGVRFGIGAGRAFKAADKAVKSGGTIADDAIAALHAAAGKPENIRGAAFGTVAAGGSVPRRVARTVAMSLGADTKYAGGLIGKYADEAILASDAPDVQALKRAVQDVIAKHGTGAGPGIKIGRDATGKVVVRVVGRGSNAVPGATSEIAHIPGTDFTLSVPAFTAPAQQAARVLGLANRIRSNPAVDPATSARLSAVVAASTEAGHTADEISKEIEAIRKYRADNAATIADATARGVQPSEYALFSHAGIDPGEVVLTQLKGYEQGLAAKADRLKKQTDNIQALRNSDEVASADPLAALALKPILREMQAKAGVALSRLTEHESTRNLAAVLQGERAAHTERAMSFLHQASLIDEASKRGGSTKRVLTDPGKSLKSLGLGADAHYIPPPEVDEPIALKQKYKNLETMRRSIKGLPPDHPMREQVADLEMKLLKARDAFYNAPGGSVPGVGTDKYSYRSILGFDPMRPGENVVAGDLNTVGEVATRAQPILDEYLAARDKLVAGQRVGGVARPERVAGESVEQLRKTVDDLRDQLYAATEPLRNPSGGLKTLDQVQEEIAAHHASLATDSERRLLEMSDTDIDLLGDEIDALHRKFDASMNASHAIKGSAISFLDNDQGRALGLQKQFLNTEDGMVGVATMAPLLAMAKWASRGDDGAAVDVARRFATRARDLFGGDQGAIQAAIRNAQYAATDGAQARGRDLLLGIAQDLRAISKEHGLTHKEDELLTLALAKEYKATGGGHVHLTDIDGNPTPMMLTLESAVRGGLLSNPKLDADLEAFAEKWGRTLTKDITERETESGILGATNTRSDYIHNAVTPKAREFIRRTTENAPDKGVPASVAQKRSAALQSFEKPRTTDSARFKSAITGKNEEVFRGEQSLQTYTDAEIDAISDPMEREAIRDRRAILDEYDRMPLRPAMKANDPMRVNELLTGGKFRSLLGTSTVPGGFMDETLGTTMFSRLTQSERAIATAQMANEVVPAAGLQITASQLRKHINEPAGTPIPLGNGATGKLVKLADDRVGIRVGDDVFRALASDVRNDHENPLVQAMGDTSLGSIFHENVASKIENAARLYNNSEFWKALDKTTAIWKTITLMHPSWTVGNMIGDAINMAMSDPKFITMLVKYPKQAMQIIRHRRDPESLAKIAMTINGAPTTGLDVWNAIHDSSVVNATLLAEPAAARAADKGIFPSRLEPIKQAFTRKAVSGDFKQAFDVESVEAGRGGLREKAKAGYRVASDRMNRGLIEPWYRANTMASDAMRVIGYLSYRDQGFSHEAAVNRLTGAAFDYANQTSFEKGVAKRLFPFWSWLKNNSVYQAKMLVNRPIYVGMFPALQRAIEESVNGEEPVPMFMRPKWMREQMSLLVGNDPETRAAVMLGNLLPQEQALLVGRFTGGLAGIQDAFKYGASSLNPLIRGALELGAGREFFSGRSIGPSTDEADISIPQYAINQLRPVREIQKIGELGGEQGIGAASARAVLGGRLQPASDERLAMSRSREFSDQEDRLRNVIRTAEFKGDKAASVIARAKLLRLYEQGQLSGAKVPKWAQKRLTELATPQGR